MKCKVCKSRERKGKTEWCDPCRLKQWRKDNPGKVKAYAKMRYKRDKKKINRKSKEYYEGHRDEVAQYLRDYKKRNPERMRQKNRKEHAKYKEKNLIRAKTRELFKELRDKGECEVCGANHHLEFHHEEPYRYDNFKILCMSCHLKVHNKRQTKLMEKETTPFSTGENK